MNKLHGKTAVITGGSSGIGYASAKKLKELGANVIITGRNEKSVEKAASELEIVGMVSDQSNLNHIDALVNEIKTNFISVDILLINAGIVAFAPIEHFTEEQFDNTMDINFKGAFFTLQKFLPILSENASVINLSSINAYTGMPNTAVYAASKAALNALTRTAAIELASNNIRVNSVNPGPVNTPVFGKLGLSEQEINAFASTVQDKVPLKRFGAPEEIANLIAFLASDEASFITGSEYNIDGGVSINSIV